MLKKIISFKVAALLFLPYFFLKVDIIERFNPTSKKEVIEILNIDKSLYVTSPALFEQWDIFFKQALIAGAKVVIFDAPRFFKKTYENKKNLVFLDKENSYLHKNQTDLLELSKLQKNNIIAKYKVRNKLKSKMNIRDLSKSIDTSGIIFLKTNISENLNLSKQEYFNKILSINYLKSKEVKISSTSFGQTYLILLFITFSSFLIYSKKFRHLLVFQCTAVAINVYCFYFFKAIKLVEWPIHNALLYQLAIFLFIINIKASFFELYTDRIKEKFSEKYKQNSESDVEEEVLWESKLKFVAQSLQVSGAAILLKNNHSSEYLGGFNITNVKSSPIEVNNKIFYAMNRQISLDELLELGKIGSDTHLYMRNIYRNGNLSGHLILSTTTEISEINNEILSMMINKLSVELDKYTAKPNELKSSIFESPGGMELDDITSRAFEDQGALKNIVKINLTPSLYFDQFGKLLEVNSLANDFFKLNKISTNQFTMLDFISELTSDFDSEGISRFLFNKSSMFTNFNNFEFGNLMNMKLTLVNSSSLSEDKNEFYLLQFNFDSLVRSNKNSSFKTGEAKSVSGSISDISQTVSLSIEKKYEIYPKEILEPHRLDALLMLSFLDFEQKLNERKISYQMSPNLDFHVLTQTKALKNVMGEMINTLIDDGVEGSKIDIDIKDLDGEITISFKGSGKGDVLLDEPNVDENNFFMFNSAIGSAAKSGINCKVKSTKKIGTEMDLVFRNYIDKNSYSQTL